MRHNFFVNEKLDILIVEFLYVLIQKTTSVEKKLNFFDNDSKT